MGSPAQREDWNQLYTQLTEAGGGNPALEWRWRKILRLLSVTRDGEGVCFIDIGCGDGAFLRRFARLYPAAQIAGIDGSSEGIARAAASLPKGSLLAVDLEAPAPPDLQPLAGVANLGLCTEVLEHLDNPVAALKNARRLLAPGSRLIVTVPAGPMSASDRFFGHRKHYRRALLRRELEEAGLEVEAMWAAGFPFHSLYRLLVVLRGAQTIHDQLDQPGILARGLTRFLFALFTLLFRANLFWPPLGWQIFAVARVPKRL